MDETIEQFRMTQFASEIDLPAGDDSRLSQATEVVLRELEATTRWKRLRCHEVVRHSRTEAGVIHELRVGNAMEFDWTWEGAQALRPASLQAFEQAASTATPACDGSELSDDAVWLADVLEVDETGGRIFVLDSSNSPPCRGAFYVRPYEFLAFLDRVYRAPALAGARATLPSRLAAAEGGVHPDVSWPAEIGLPLLRAWWRKSWSVIWGPPGTGKTYTIGRQVAAVLEDPSERVLIVSTTNKATDGVAMSIGRAIARGHRRPISKPSAGSEKRPTCPSFARSVWRGCCGVPRPSSWSS
ncbi:AAA domain-containing protein [Botrimarina mediterranea]|uniref:AAA domain-containing protein n=1 Tax=Botrimarina mediterranea TaxID=2528022 RepID=UPI00118D46FD|nr:AAA domain-containing protein [Botrimarina mediterranea]QDV78929.1 RecBCD enzyme subunit RecD [Planctomycetes bacterium K2D]